MGGPGRARCLGPLGRGGAAELPPLEAASWRFGFDGAGGRLAVNMAWGPLPAEFRNKSWGPASGA